MLVLVVSRFVGNIPIDFVWNRLRENVPFFDRFCLSLNRIYRGTARYSQRGRQVWEIRLKVFETKNGLFEFIKFPAALLQTAFGDQNEQEWREFNDSRHWNFVAKRH